MKRHYRQRVVVCNKAATSRLTSTEEPSKVTCKHCRRALRKGVQQELFR